MPTNFIRFSRRGDDDKTPRDSDVEYDEIPECFGESWDPNDDDYCQICDLFDECADEFSKRTRASTKRQQSRSLTTSAASSTTRYSGSTHENGAGIVRPKTPEGLPPGSEYCDPEQDGNHGVVKRAFAMMYAEGMAAFGDQIGRSFSRFARDPTNWHKHAGRRKYGENFGPIKKEARTTKKTPRSSRNGT